MRVLFNTMKAVILFVACTAIFYYGILWVTDELSELHRYDVPEGNALKASSIAVSDEDMNVLQRLTLFLLDGE
ncbi:YqzK family protein [Shouchella sp. JSM 1781072]|uniref:YqzK family protein n=1 Tax=Bacillaceae TaxID=186817 RepID=UPI000C08477E|nr:MULTISPECIES: YqzK family protein [Bacillaceae]UTR08063.1 YqzK family protein [Alkalihalobacillus sp. LMS6]